MDALNVSDSWDLLEQTAVLLSDQLPPIPTSNANLGNVASLLPKYGDGYVRRQYCLSSYMYLTSHYMYNQQSMLLVQIHVHVPFGTIADILITSLTIL